MKPSHIVIVGTTASGKSDLAMKIAQSLANFEVVVADSMQGYRCMDIGTAKPTVEDQKLVRHHLLDVLDPTEEYSLGLFLQNAREALADIESRNKRALIVGGTGLYVQALCDGFEIPGQFPDAKAELNALSTPQLFAKLEQLDPTAMAKIEPDNRRRMLRALEVTIGSGRTFSSYGPKATLALRTHKIGLWITRSENAARIRHRIETMFDLGWEDEVRTLLNHKALSRTAERAIGYSSIIGALRSGRSGRSQSEEIAAATTAFARRQRVWFRRDPSISWYGAAKSASTYPSVLADLADWFGSGGEK